MSPMTPHPARYMGLYNADITANPGTIRQAVEAAGVGKDYAAFLAAVEATDFAEMAVTHGGRAYRVFGAWTEPHTFSGAAYLLHREVMVSAPADRISQAFLLFAHAVKGAVTDRDVRRGNKAIRDLGVADGIDDEITTY